MTDLQKAIYDLLTAELPCPVYDHVPEGTAYPYVTIEHLTGNDESSLSKARDGVNVYLAVWSTYQGSKEVLDIINLILAAVRANRRLPPAADLAVRRWYTNRDVDDKTYMGYVTLRAVMES